MIPPSDEPAGYRLIADTMRDQITSGVLAPGTRLPSEADIAKLWGVANETARRAMRVLRTEGLVVRERGKPSRVRTPVKKDVIKVHANADIDSRMPTLAEAKALGIGEAVPVLVVSYLGEVELYASDRVTLRTA